MRVLLDECFPRALRAELPGHEVTTVAEWGLAMSAKYEVINYWSTEDRAFIAEAPELPGCMADGNSHQNALANLEIVIQEWIETATELGRPIPKPRGRLMFA